MENGVVGNDGGVCFAETASGGRDVWSSKVSESSSADHLVVMVHGILGRLLTSFFLIPLIFYAFQLFTRLAHFLSRLNNIFGLVFNNLVQNFSF